MPPFACPVCRDPNAYPLWLDSIPPAGCPNEPGLMPGYGICAIKLADAKEAAMWRRVAPECFDDRGNMLPDSFDQVMKKLEEHQHYP